MSFAFLPPRLSLLLLCGLLLAPVARAADPLPPASAPFAWDTGTQGGFVTSLCQDTQGRVWVGTEDQGVWRYDPTAPAGKQYAHFTQKDGLGDDDAYALACDKQGRVWVGTLNHGVSVTNGQTWKTYGIAEGLPGVHVTALAVSPTDGAVWGATEAGLFRFSPAHHSWTEYGQAEGLPNAPDALAFDPKGVLYVGTQADGIAVGSPADNYKKWRVVPGPAQPPNAPSGPGLPTGLVNCLLVSRSGTVWAGTDGGLARSVDSGKTWTFTRGADWLNKASGRLPPDPHFADQPEINAVEIIPAVPHSAEKPIAIAAVGGGAGAFAADTNFTGGGTYTATAAMDTANVAHPAPVSVYQAERWGSFACAVPHLTPLAPYQVRLHFAENTWTAAGQRVFNMLLNGKTVLTDFDVFAAAGGANKAVVKEFTTTADAQGRILIQSQGPNGLTAPFDPHLLSEDYVTALAEDGAGHLLVGHRQQGLEARDATAEIALTPDPKTSDPKNAAADFVTAILPREGQPALIGGYGSGLTPMGTAILQPPASPKAVVVEASPLPSPANPPTLAELNERLKRVSLVAPDPHELQTHVTALADDWLTEGDWLGRYGRYWACLAATFHPIPVDYLWGAGWEPISYALTTGPNHGGDDRLRYFLGSRYTDDPSALELPPTYLHSRMLKGYTDARHDRRTTIVDDHGEVYPQSLDGPHVYCSLTIPTGLFTLSLYSLLNGRSGMDRIHDHLFSIRLHTGASLEDVSTFAALPGLAHSRLRQAPFGVWKRFLVRGPTTLTVEMNRNGSFNTSLNAVMLDLVDEDPAPYFHTVDQWNAREVQRKKARQRLAASPARFRPATSEADAANRLFDALAEKRLINSVWWATEGRRDYAALLRWYAALAKQPAAGPRPRLFGRLATCYYQTGQYAAWEEGRKSAGDRTARDIEKSLRWDGVTDSYSGLGYEIVTAHLAEQSGHKEGKAP